MGERVAPIQFTWEQMSLKLSEQIDISSVRKSDSFSSND